MRSFLKMILWVTLCYLLHIPDTSIDISQTTIRALTASPWITKPCLRNFKHFYSAQHDVRTYFKQIRQVMPTFDLANTPHIPLLGTGSQSQDSSTPEAIPASKRRIILLEDLPNILHPGTRDKFHLALESFVKSTNPGDAPIVIIVSDTGLRGEASDEKRSQGMGSWGKEVVDIRTVLPPTLLGSTYVTQIG
jgi:hypothetical protein